ncbi:MAG: S26 family signal peptidase [Gammaproteobacteria bacterium]|nr:S26 family signal peptidase [Gammaproteobacteria bacterium]
MSSDLTIKLTQGLARVCPWLPDSERLRVLIVSLLIVGPGWFAFDALTGFVGSHYQFKYDTQHYTCLPWRAYLIHMRPPARIRHGQILGFYPHGRMGPSFDAPGLMVYKMVAGVPGDELLVENDKAYVNGRYLGPLDLIHRLGKPSGYYDRHQIVPNGQYLLVGTLPRTYDGRYWGFVPAGEIIAELAPLW